MIKTNNTFRADFRDGTLHVVLEGEIDHHSAVGVRGEIDRMIYEKRPKRLELELSRIGFMDSSGLGLVMGRYSLIRDLGGEMVVQNPSAAIMRIFKLAGMDRLIRIETFETPVQTEAAQKTELTDPAAEEPDPAPAQDKPAAETPAENDAQTEKGTHQSCEKREK